MFDLLDDPLPAAPGPAAHAAVLARAARLRRNRRAAWAACAASAVAATTLLYAVRAPGIASLEPATTTPSPTATASGSARPAEALVPARTATTFDPAAPPVAGGRTTPVAETPSAGSAPAGARFVGHGQGGSCLGESNPNPGDAGSAPYPDVTMTLHVPATVDGGSSAASDPDGYVVFRNGGDVRVEFRVATGAEGRDGEYGIQTTATDDAGRRSAYYYSAAAARVMTDIVLDPGGSARLPVRVRTHLCEADTYYHPSSGTYEHRMTPLAPGWYQVGVVVTWEVQVREDTTQWEVLTRGAIWRAAPLTMRVL